MKKTLFLKQTFKSLGKTKFSIILLSFFLFICTWLICSFSFMYKSLSLSINLTQTDSNLATAMVSTTNNNYNEIKFNGLDTTRDFQTTSVVTLNPYFQDPNVTTNINNGNQKALDSIRQYYINQTGEDLFTNKMWAFVSSPGQSTAIPDTVDTLTKYTGLMVGQKNHLITVNDLYVKLNKNKLPNFVDVWTLYKDGLPLNINDAKFTIDPYSFVGKEINGKTYLLGTSNFKNAIVENIELNTDFTVSHVLFDISNNVPVTNSAIVPTKNTLCIDKNDPYIASVGYLPEINTNFDDWKPTSNGLPNWSLATPKVSGYGVHAVYGRVYQSICANEATQIKLGGRIYKPSVNFDSLNSKQKVVAALINPNKVNDEKLKQDLINFSNQFNNNQEFQKLIKNIQGCLEPTITVVETPTWKNQFKKIEDFYNHTFFNTQKKINTFFNEIVDFCLSDGSFVNHNSIKLKDIINKYGSFDSELEKLNIVASTTNLLNAQVNKENLDVIFACKGENPIVNKVISNDYEKLFDKKFNKKYDEIQLLQASNEYIKFGLKYGWDSTKFQKAINHSFTFDNAKQMQPSFLTINWFLKQLNYFGVYNDLQKIIDCFQIIGTSTNFNEICDSLKILLDNFQFESITLNNSMLELSFKCRSIGTKAPLVPMNANYIENNAYLAIVNDSWLESNPNKEVIPDDELNKLMQYSYGYSNNENEPTFVQSILELNDKYKIDVNGKIYIIVGSGVSADLAYPCTNQYSFSKQKNAVLYVNQKGFEQAKQVDNNNERVWVGIQSKNGQQLDLNVINKSLNSYLDNQNFYFSNDKNMDDKILYQSINFPSELVNKIFFLCILFSIVSAIFAILVIFMNMKHVIKNNINWIGIAIANGYSKKRFIFNNWATSLCISVSIGFLASLISIFTYPLLNYFIIDYWTIPIVHLNLFFVIPIVCLLLFIIIYIGSILISISLLNSSTLNLINNKKENAKNNIKFKNDKNISVFKLTSRFILSKFGKIFGITSVSLFVSFLVSISVGLSGQFINSYNISQENVNYNYAMNLYSPTIQGGGYNINNFNQILDSTNKESLPIYDKGSAYASKTEFITNPYSNIKMTNLWLPESDILIRELNNSLQFLNGKMINQLALNMNVEFNGSYINLWERAINILPASFISFINKNTNQMLTTAYNFYLAMDNDKQLEANYYEQMVANKPSTLPYNPWTFDGSPINTTNDENNMLFKQQSNIWKWKTEGKPTIIDKSFLGTISMKSNAMRLLTYLVTNHQNPVYTKWCKENNYKVVYPYWLGLNEVCLEYFVNENVKQNIMDSTYSYLEASTNIENKKIIINGIPINTSFITLRDYQNSNVILNKLIEFPITIDNNGFMLKDKPFPMIISEVASRLDNKDVGDIYTVNIDNYLTRFTDKFNKNVNNFVQNVQFKVVGISSEKMKASYWIDKDVADQLLGYTVLKSEQRFNGIYFKSSSPIELNNITTIYSPSGMTVLSTSFPSTYDDLDENILRNPLVNNIYNVDLQTGKPLIDAIVKFDLVESLPEVDGIGYGGQTEKAVEAVKKLNSIFGATLITNSIVGGDIVPLSNQFSKSMDGTIQDFTILILLVFLPILLCVNILFTALLIEDINNILGLLLTLGYSKFKLIGIFTLSISIWMLLGFILGIGLSYIVPLIFNQIIWTSFNIITNASIGIIEILSVLASYLLFVGIVWSSNKLKLERTSILSLISCFQIG